MSDASEKTINFGKARFDWCSEPLYYGWCNCGQVWSSPSAVKAMDWTLHHACQK